MAICTIGRTTCGEILSFPRHDWHPGQGSGYLFANLATPYIIYLKWGSTICPPEQTGTQTHGDFVLNISLPSYIQIGVTARTSVRVPYPYPSFPTGDQPGRPVDSRLGGVTLGRLTDAVRQAATALTLSCWLHLQPPVMRRTVSRLFWETACILRLQWDPNKDPRINSGYKIYPSETSQSGTAQIFSECDTESQTPILIYTSLETLTAKLGEIKVGKIGPGPGLKKIRRQVAETNAAMENILMDTIHRLYARAVTC